MRKITTTVAALTMSALMSVVALTGCGNSGGNPLDNNSSGSGKGGSSGGGGKELVVGGANFTESKVLAAVYAGALNAKGIKATTKPDIGSREAYLGALKDGSVDIFAEYTGNLTVFYDKNASATSAQGWYDALKKALPSYLTAYNMSPAVDNDSVTVTKETAQKYKLKTISDLKPVASKLVLGGPAEWATRPRTGVPALKKTYGLTFQGDYKRLDGALAVQALRNGQVDAANIFTTDPSIFEFGFVVLQDDKHLFPANNVVPIANKSKVSSKAAAVLNSVSAKLDTKSLASMDKAVDVDKKSASDVAQTWLKDNGLG